MLFCISQLLVELFHVQLHIKILRVQRMRVIRTIQLWVLCVLFHFWNYFSATCLWLWIFLLQIFVGNLDGNVTDDHLRQVFSKYGELVHVKIPMGKRCGFVQFADRWADLLVFSLGIVSMDITESNLLFCAYASSEAVPKKHCVY